MDDFTSLGDALTPMSNQSDIEFVSDFEGEINSVGDNIYSINNDEDVNDTCHIQDE